jgi:lipid-binding SYLF domain-containing protein
MTTHPPDDGPRPGLHAPQFGMTTLLAGMAGLSVVFAVWAAGGPVAAFVVILFILAVIAHVAGNAVGTKLKENGSRRPRNDDAQTKTIELSSEHYAPTTKLSEKSSLGVTIIILTVAGFVIGAVGGGGLLTYLNWEKIIWPSIALAAIASGVLGGLAGFMMSSFVHVMFVAQLQAWRHGRRK